MNLLDVDGVAAALERSRSWFYAHRRQLEARGFPRPLPVVGRWDAEAIDAWRLGAARTGQAVVADQAAMELDRAFGL